jgi:hypothetical protein
MTSIDDLIDFQLDEPIPESLTSNIQTRSMKKKESINVKKICISLIKEDQSCILVKLPNKHNMCFYPYIISGTARSKGIDNKTFCVDAFIINLQSDFPSIVNMDIIHQTLKIQLLSNNNILLNYDINNVTIERNGKSLILKVSSHLIDLSSHSDCKKINGRSDGMKQDVGQFFKKQRNLQVSFTDNKSNYLFSCNVLCVSSMSFNNSLKSYRDDSHQIENLFSYIQKMSDPHFMVEPANENISTTNINIENIGIKRKRSVDLSIQFKKIICSTELDYSEADEFLSDDITGIKDDENEPPMKKQKFNNFTKLLNVPDNIDPISVELYNYNLKKINRIYGEIMQTITKSGVANMEMINNVISIFSLALQYTFESLIHNKNNFII